MVNIERTDSFPFCKITKDETMFHVGDTTVRYKTTCDEEENECTTTFTSFQGDGFWDPLDLSSLPDIEDDKSAPAGELYGATPFLYNAFFWDVTFLTPETRNGDK